MDPTTLWPCGFFDLHSQRERRQRPAEKSDHENSRYAAALLLAMNGVAMAWEPETDPFSGSNKITAFVLIGSGFGARISGAAVICDTSEDGITVRAIPGYTHDGSDSAAISLGALNAAFADDKRLETVTVSDASAGTVGSDQLAIDLLLDKEASEAFLNAMAAARKSIMVKDGVNSGPIKLSARGSSAAAKKLLECVKAQP
ncbi:hypothetical protein [Paenirhodobacter sp.]|uniref:hypothetical protein n=1 Tax=Paenirhodobacter sp. TaxID=1965326 RepID=UPI003B40E1FF